MECPFCKAEVEVTQELAGVSVQCPACSGYFTVPRIQRCPSCGDASFGKRRICVNCGYDFTQGANLRTKTEDDTEHFTFREKVIMYINDNCPGIVRIPALIGFIFCTAVALGTVFLGFVVLMLGAILTAIAIFGAGMAIYMHGLAFICTGSLCTLKSACMEMRGSCWSLFLTLTFLPFFIVFLLMGLGVISNA